ncbi:DUF1566 domain-containing protein [bacterium]|nr:DUF1566 domain-containing protein [bacterium]
MSQRTVKNNKKIFNDETRLLSWKRDISNDAVPWEAALGRAEQCNSGGDDGWRLPTIEELQSLITTEQDENGFFWASNQWNYSGQGSWFWSSTQDEDGNIYYVNFSSGETDAVNSNERLQYIFVRDLKRQSEPDTPADDKTEDSPKTEEAGAIEESLVGKTPLEIKNEVDLPEVSEKDEKSSSHGGIFYFFKHSLVFIFAVSIFTVMFFVLYTPSMETADVLFQARKINPVFEKYAKSIYKKYAEHGRKDAEKIVNNWTEYKKLNDSDVDFKDTLVKAWRGDVKSQFNLARIYERSKNFDEAVIWYKKAKDNGMPEAGIIVDNWSEYKNFAAFNDNFRNRQMEALQDDGAGQLALGNFYYSSDVEHNKEFACKWWLKASEKNLAEAIYKTGNCYEAGIIAKRKIDEKDGGNAGKKATKNDQKKEEDEPLKSWLKAADMGYAAAQIKVAECYYYGTCGSVKNYSSAMNFLKKAAEHNDEARKKLADWFLEYFPDSLHWSDKNSSQLTLEKAEKYCEDLDEGGFSDWRLPNIDELRTLIKDRKTAFREDCGVSERNGCLAKNSSSCFTEETCFFENTEGMYSKKGDGAIRLWSSSKDPEHISSAWFVYFGNGSLSIGDYNDKGYVRCVR